MRFPQPGYAQTMSHTDVPSSVPEPGDATGSDAGPGTTPHAERQPDPLRGSRTSGFWFTVLLLVVLLLLLAVFILQNTQRVEVTFLGWNGHAPLAATLLIATVAGAVVVAAAGALRILQLRRRVKRERKR